MKFNAQVTDPTTNREIFQLVTFYQRNRPKAESRDRHTTFHVSRRFPSVANERRI